MRRLHLGARTILMLVGFALVAARLTAQGQGPVASMYADDQLRGKALALGFLTLPVPGSNGAAQVYVTSGDLERAFDIDRFRPDAAIVPTNTGLQLTATSPATQRVLVERVQKQPAAMKALQDQVDARRGRAAAGSRSQGVMDIGVDSFVATLPRGQGNAFPASVCLIATDFATGGAIDQRQLFAQDRVRKGIAACLTSLDMAGAKSVVVPLVGAASSGTQARDPQYEGQRVLMECRLLNAVAGITLGIHDFAASRRNVKEIGIIQWDEELFDMFGARRGADMSRAAQSAYRTYTNQVKTAIRKGLAGQPTSGSDVSGTCSAVFSAR